MGICAHLGDSAVSTAREEGGARGDQDRKSTRLNSSHSQISYAVFCLKKKKQTPHPETSQQASTNCMPHRTIPYLETKARTVPITLTHCRLIPICPVTTVVR